MTHYKSALHTLTKLSLHLIPWQEMFISPYWSTQRCPPSTLCTQVVTFFHLYSSLCLSVDKDVFV